MGRTPVSEYGKIKVGVKTLDDATFNLSALATTNRRLGNKQVVLKALADQDIDMLREISNYFYRTSGIYHRICNYFATMQLQVVNISIQIQQPPNL